jgi:ubiquinone/menaquinone biosynthesis C-methylase UbiE
MMARDPLQLRCPECGNVIDSPADGRSCSCGTLAFVGGVWNALGSPAYMFDAERDLSIAQRLVGHVGSDGFLGSVGSATTSVTRDSAEDVVLAAGLDRREATALMRATSLSQVTQDVHAYFGGSPGDRQLAAFFEERAAPKPAGMVLDVGCSTGALVLRKLNASGARLVGLDRSFVSMAIGRAAWNGTQLPNSPTWVAGDVLHMPFRDASFTHVTSSVTLAHVPIRPALAEIRRVLIAGGDVLCTLEGQGFILECWRRAPTWSRSRLGIMRMWLGHIFHEWGFEWREHPVARRLAGYTGYSPRYIETVFKDAGLAVKEISILREFEGVPRLVGVHAKKPG